MSTSLRETLNTTPRTLAFGTSGLRGLVLDLTQLETAINTLGFLRFLAARNLVEAGDAICLAGDLRPSTWSPVVVDGHARGEIAQAVAWAITQAGYRPANLGEIPTPALLHYALSRGQASVMITGSHIPFDRNGIKFNKPDGEVLKADEPAILDQVRTVRDQLYSQCATESPFQADGHLKASCRFELPDPDSAGRDTFLARYLGAFPAGALQGKRILVYQHSAVGRDLLVELLEQLGAMVVPAGRSDRFIPIDTEAVDITMLAEIQQLVDTHGGGQTLDAVVSTDGDSDRPLLLALQKGQVEFIGGDLLGILVADYLGAKQVAVPISVNDAVDRFFTPQGVAVTKTRIGSPHVIAAMHEVGWEANGGFLTTRTCHVPGGGDLQPLPTRDAFLPLLAALCSARDRQTSLSSLRRQLPARFGKSDLLRQFPRETSLAILQQFQPSHTSLEQVDFEETGPQVHFQDETEATTPDPKLASELLKSRDAFREYFPTREGFADVRWINFLDGVRLGLADGSVVHIRPSGNAPELRVYATADTQEQAEELVRKTTEPAGVLRRLEQEVIQPPTADQTSTHGSVHRLHGTVMHYAWGGTDFIPALLGLPNPERRPFAELWLGAHRSAPSRVDLADGTDDLRRLIQRAPRALLGARVASRFDNRLPYLLKVLDARQMLSIQVHPNADQARDGFQRETTQAIPLDAPERIYKDDRPKPEVHVALTPFWMLHGFRTLEAFGAILQRTPELNTVWPRFRDDLRASGDDQTLRRQLLRKTYEHVMALPQTEVDLVLRPLLERLRQGELTDRDSPEYWVCRAAEQFARPDGTCDRGLFSIYFLNLVHLQPGESTFQGAGVPHAYLEGTTVELMANSDNVVRGGLTPKHMDVSELLKIMDFSEGRPPISQGQPATERETTYPTPAAEFVLSRNQLRPGESFEVKAVSGPECWLLTEGEANARSEAVNLRLERGESAVVFWDHKVRWEAGTNGATLFRARVP